MSESSGKPKSETHQHGSIPSHMQFFKWSRMHRLSKTSVDELQKLCYVYDGELKDFFFSLMTYYHKQMEADTQYKKKKKEEEERKNREKEEKREEKKQENNDNDDEVQILLEKRREIMNEMAQIEEEAVQKHVEDNQNDAELGKTQNEAVEVRAEPLPDSTSFPVEASVTQSATKDLTEFMYPAIRVKDEIPEDPPVATAIEAPVKSPKIKIGTTAIGRESSVTSSSSNVAVSRAPQNDAAKEIPRKKSTAAELEKCATVGPAVQNAPQKDALPNQQNQLVNPTGANSQFAVSRQLRTIFNQMNKQIEQLNRTKDLANDLKLNLPSCTIHTVKLFNPNKPPTFHFIEQAAAYVTKELEIVKSDLSQSLLPSAQRLLIQVQEIQKIMKGFITKTKTIESKMRVNTDAASSNTVDMRKSIGAAIQGKKRPSENDGSQWIPMKKSLLSNPVNAAKSNEGQARVNVSTVCAFCSGFHDSIDCTEYSTSESRAQRKKELDLCFYCLDHFTQGHHLECPTFRNQCTVCKMHSSHPAFCRRVCAKVTKKMVMEAKGKQNTRREENDKWVDDGSRFSP